jgi:hypothetical protein
MDAEAFNQGTMLFYLNFNEDGAGNEFWKKACNLQLAT